MPLGTITEIGCYLQPMKNSACVKQYGTFWVMAAGRIDRTLRPASVRYGDDQLS
jgi:hypothetical protein